MIFNFFNPKRHELVITFRLLEIICLFHSIYLQVFNLNLLPINTFGMGSLPLAIISITFPAAYPPRQYRENPIKTCIGLVQFEIYQH